MGSSQPGFGWCSKCGKAAGHEDLLANDGICPECRVNRVDRTRSFPEHIHRQDYRLAVNVLAHAGLSRAAIRTFGKQYREPSARPCGRWICTGCATLRVDCAAAALYGDDGEPEAGWRTRLAALLAVPCRGCRAPAAAVVLERRRSPRFHIRGKPLLFCAPLPAVSSSRPDLGLDVIDLSETGLRCRLKLALPPGEHVFVRIQSAADEAVSAVGQIRWSRAAADSFEHGIVFTQVEPADRARLMRLRDAV